MNRTLSPDKFEQLKNGGVADCEAADVSEKLTSLDLHPKTVAVAVSFERERRLKRYETAIYDALEARVAELLPQKRELDETLHVAEYMLAKRDENAKDAEDAEEPIKPVLSDELVLQLSNGTVTKDTFVKTAMLYGHTANISARTFYDLARSNHDDWGIVDLLDLDALFNLVVVDVDSDGQHPLLKRHRFGPAMLDTAFTVCEAYLKARETIEVSK